MLAGAALLMDYILTVSDSVSAGVRAVTSAFPEVFEYQVLIALGAIFFIDILSPLVEYIVSVNEGEFPEKITTVVVPEFVPEHSSGTNST